MSKRNQKRSTDIEALTKEAGKLYEHVEKELQKFGQKYDLKKMAPKSGNASGDGYFFVIAKSHSIKKNSDFTWGQSNYNFPVAAIAGTLDAVAQATIKTELLNLFAQNLGHQFKEQYGEDFAEAITMQFYDFLQNNLGNEQKS